MGKLMEMAAAYEKRTYSVTEISEILGVSMTTAYSLLRRNLFQAVRVGHTYRISKKSFDEWLDGANEEMSSVQIRENKEKGRDAGFERM